MFGERRPAARRLRALSYLFILASTAGRARAHEPGEESAATMPVLTERVQPTYPEAARRAGVAGTVGLKITVGVDGRVKNVVVMRSAGFGFDEAAVAAAQN